MNKKITTLSLLSVCISLAIHPSAQAEPLLPVATEAIEISCPADMNQLSEDEKRALPESCQASAENVWLSDEAMLTTVSALGAGALIAIAAASGGSGKGGGGMTDGGGDSGGHEGGGDYTDWDVNNKFEGDGKENTLDKDVSTGAGEIGNLVTGNNTENTISGNTEVTEGGKGTVVDGNNTSTTNNGDSSVSGEGSVGLEVNGNGATVNNNGNNEIVGGGSGTVVNGNDANVTNTGDILVSGEGSAGTVVIGDNATIVNEGNSTVTGGGTGTLVDGNNVTVINTGDTTISGEGSTGTLIIGENSEAHLSGSLLVTNGATGIQVNGREATLSNQGNITVRDNGSVGVDVSSANAVFINTGDVLVTHEAVGVQLSSDRASVTVDGNVRVDATEQRLAATGVNISGNSGVLVIKGNVQVDDISAVRPGEREDTQPDLTGVAVNGNGNQVEIDGQVSVNYRGIVESRPVSGTARYGLHIVGDDNIVRINGGLGVDYRAEFTGSGYDVHDHGDQYGLKLAGNNNNVVLTGESSYHTEGFVNANTFLLYSSGENNRILLDESFNLIAESLSDAHNSTFLFYSYGEGSLLHNRGQILSQVSGSVLVAGNGATVINDGDITGQLSNISTLTIRSIIDVREKSAAYNSESGKLTVHSWMAPYNYGVSGTLGGVGVGNEYGAMIGNGYLSNAGLISVSGAGTYGMTSSSGQLVNSGTILVDGMQLMLDEDGNDSGEKQLFTARSERELRGVGMHIRGSGTAFNTGTITVTNSGSGMFAGGTSAVVNQGTINLESDDSHNADGWIYAMTATGNGVAINDTNGIININTDLGQAFYTAGNGMIINKGTVNLNGTEIHEGDTNWGAGTVEFDGEMLFDSVLSKTGETRDFTPNVTTLGTVANYGQTRFASDLVSAGGWLHNFGEMNVAGELTANTGLNNVGHLNAGTLSSWGTGVHNSGTLRAEQIALNENARLVNEGTFYGTVLGVNDRAHSRIVNSGTLTVENNGDSVVAGRFVVHNMEGGLITNTGAATDSDSVLIDYTHTNRQSFLINRGDIVARNGYGVFAAKNTSSGNTAWLYNLDTGRIIGENMSSGQALMTMGQGFSLYNSGEISFQGNGTVGVKMSTSNYTNYVVNDGVINVGTEEGKVNGTNGSGLTGILANRSSNVIYNNTDGVINVWADDSAAFGASSNGGAITLVNNGAVNLLCDTGCTVVSGGLVAGEGNDYTGTGTPENTPSITVPSAPQENSNLLTGYTIGTNADGSAGTLRANQLDIGHVTIDTGFTTGMADKTVTFTNVLSATGSITGENNIASSSVVWNAQGHKNANGNVDVTMTKNDYAALVTDSQVNHLADALDKGYTNNSLFNSLNVSSVSALNNALKQLSGVQAKSLNREARVLGQRFTMLADSAPVTTDSGLSFNVVAKGDTRAEMANKVTYDMMALGQHFDTAYGEVTARYGMARLSGNGGNHRERAGDNGLTGGYSQFFGLSHRLPLSDNNVWENSLRWDLHQLDSRRHLSFEGLSEVASASGRQQQLSFRSEGVKTLTLQDGWTMSPFAGMKLRHHITDGYQEHGAGDFNLSVNRYSETAVDAVAGLRLNYVGKDGWGAQAVLEAGPNLSFSQSQRTASLQGLQGQSFRVEDGKKGGGVNGQAVVGANYQKDNLSFDMNAYQWQEDGAADKGFRLNVTRRF